MEQPPANSVLQSSILLKRVHATHTSNEYEQVEIIKRGRANDAGSFEEERGTDTSCVTIDDDKTQRLPTRNAYLLTVAHMNDTIIDRLKHVFATHGGAKDEFVKTIELMIGRTDESDVYRTLIVVEAWKSTDANILARHLSIDDFADSIHWSIVDPRNVAQKRLLTTARDRDRWIHRVFGVRLPTSYEARYLLFLHAIKDFGWDNARCAEVCAATERRYRAALLAASNSSNV